MANMSYCRFENTLNDMKDCLYALEEAGSKEEYVKEDTPSEYEMSAINEMKQIAEQLAEKLEE